MFKNMLVYKFEEPFTLDVSALNEKLKQKPITPCLTQEMESLGWIELDDYSDEFAMQVNKAIFFRLCVERKLLPNSVVNTAIKARIKELNLKHVSRSDHKELHEYVVNKLLPKALVDRSYIYAYIDLETNRLVVNASSTKKASLLTSHLRKTLGSLKIIPAIPDHSINSTMTSWVLHKAYMDKFRFQIMNNIAIKELKDEGASLSAKELDYDGEEIHKFLKDGWQVTSLMLEFDDSMQFKLDATFILKGIKYLDHFRDQLDDEDDPRLQWQTESYLMVDYHRRAFTALFDLCN